jgi:hypothetical protein
MIMKLFGKIFVMIVLLSSTFVSYGMAQSNPTDFCQRHAELWDKDGRLTIKGHKMLYLEHPEWWFDSENKEWKEWPSQKPQWSIDEHKNLHTTNNKPEWWFDSQKKEWKEWTHDQRETLECHKKLYIDGPQWWFDSQNKEWKRWPK